ncbi:MAG: TMEM175 family protein [Actinomycetota bacterium]|nr:TMEM175 family protein [Actinomycetota bacterium]
MTTGRLEAFSDGVFAIAITLLILEIRVPEAGAGGLWHALTEEWPSFAAFFVSFLVIGIIWVNHHAVLDHIKRATRPLLFINLLLLFSVAFIPFPTALMAEHLESGVDEEVAAAVYMGAMSLMAVAFGVLWTYITSHRDQLGVELSEEEISRRTKLFTAGTPIYLLSIGLAFVSPEAVLVVTALLAVYYAVAGGMKAPERT